MFNILNQSDKPLIVVLSTIISPLCKTTYTGVGLELWPLFVFYKTVVTCYIFFLWTLSDSLPLQDACMCETFTLCTCKYRTYIEY